MLSSVEGKDCSVKKYSAKTPQKVSLYRLWALRASTERLPETTCTLLAFMSEGVEIRKHLFMPKHRQHTMANSIMLFQMSFGSSTETRRGSKSGKTDGLVGTELHNEDRTELIQGTEPRQHGNQSWQLVIISEQSVIGYCKTHNQEKPKRNVVIPFPSTTYLI